MVEWRSHYFVKIKNSLHFCNEKFKHFWKLLESFKTENFDNSWVKLFKDENSFIRTPAVITVDGLPLGLNGFCVFGCHFWCFKKWNELIREKAYFQHRENKISVSQMDSDLKLVETRANLFNRSAHSAEPGFLIAS